VTNETIAPEELEVTAADRQAEEHARMAMELERRVADGDDDVTAEQIDRQHGLSRFAKLRAAGARRKAELAEQARVVQARKDLRAEIDNTSLHSGEKIAGLLRAVDDAVRSLVAATDEQEAVIAGWIKRLKELGVPHTGYPSPDHEGLGQGGPGDVLAGDLAIRRVSGPHLLSAILAQGEYGSIWPQTPVDINGRVPGQKRIDAACIDLARMISGKAS